MNQADAPATDIFLWANNTDGMKNELEVELFLFTKHYTPLQIPYASSLSSQLKPLLLFDYISEVTLGAGTGLAVREFELSEAEDNVLLRTTTEKVGRAGTLVHLIEHERKDIEVFTEDEHDFKNIKGVIARFTHPSKPDVVFYTVRALQQSQVLRGASSWEFRDNKLGAFQANAGLKLAGDSQVLIVGEDIFAYNPRKFETLFQYDYKKQVLADKKVAEIEAQYNLSFPDGVDMQQLVKDRKKTVSKLQKLELGAISQDQVIDYADTMQLDLMTDDAGAIIIMDGRDLDTFINLINEDYITSEITGKRYEIKSKKALDAAEGEPPRGVH